MVTKSDKKETGQKERNCALKCKSLETTANWNMSHSFTYRNELSLMTYL